MSSKARLSKGGKKRRMSPLAEARTISPKFKDEFDQYLVSNIDREYLSSLSPAEASLFLGRCFVCYALRSHINEDQYLFMAERLGQSPALYLRNNDFDIAADFLCDLYQEALIDCNL